jgi:hypothetical protein
LDAFFKSVILFKPKKLQGASHKKIAGKKQNLPILQGVKPIYPLKFNDLDL